MAKSRDIQFCDCPNCENYGQIPADEQLWHMPDFTLLHPFQVGYEETYCPELEDKLAGRAVYACDCCGELTVNRFAEEEDKEDAD